MPKYGLAPILNDGYVATLHHSQQRSVEPLFGASTRYHNISNAKKDHFTHIMDYYERRRLRLGNPDGITVGGCHSR